MLSIPMIGFSALIIVFNFWIFIRTVVRKQKAPSAAPFLGSLLCSLGLYIMPVNLNWYYLLIPHFVDYGGVFGIALMLYQKDY